MSVGKMVIKTIEKLGNIVLDPDRDTMTRVLAAIGLVVIAGIGLFSKTIALFVGGLALKALLAFAGLTLGVLFSPIGAIILAVIAAVAGAFKAFKTYKEAKELYKKTSKKHRATLAYAINKAGRYANMNHLDDFKKREDYE